MAGIITFTKGDTWSFTGTAEFTDASGNKTSASNWTITSYMYNDKKNIVFTFDTSWLNAATGSFIHRASSGQTGLMKADIYTFSIKFTSSSGEIVTSEVVTVKVVDGN